VHGEGKAGLVRLARRDDGNARFTGDALRLELVAARAQRLRRRAGPHELRCSYRLREVGVLREEAVPGVNRIRTCLPRRADVLLREEVARDLDRLVARPGVQRALVVGRYDGDRRDSELPTRAKDSQRDLAPVRDDELPDHTTFLPGLSKFFGSNARFTAVCSSAPFGPSCAPSHGVFTAPTPCSPEIVPPRRNAIAKSSSDAGAAGFASASLSRASRNVVCRFPSPACPHDAAGKPRRAPTASDSSIPSASRSSGTAMSSLALPPRWAMTRNATPCRQFHNAATSSGRSGAWTAIASSLRTSITSARRRAASSCEPSASATTQNAPGGTSTGNPTPA